MGSWSADGDSIGSRNTLYGAEVCRNLKGGWGNTVLGFNAGYNLTGGSKNVFIGYQAGFFETGSDKLYINNIAADSAYALVYGEFDNRILEFNSSVGINTYPDVNYNLTIKDNNETGDLKISGVGDLYNYATIALVSEPENKLWQINHSKDNNAFKLIFYNGTDWSVNFVVDTLGGAKLNTNLTMNGTDSISANNEIFFSDYGQIRSSDNNHRIIFDRGNNILEFREYGSIIFSSGSTNGERTTNMIVNNLGDVGIGTASPTEQLDVNGNINATGKIQVGTKVNRAAQNNADLIPVAYGKINSTGAISSGSGNFSVVKTGSGTYQITIVGETYNSTAYTTLVTPNNTTSAIIPTTNGSSGNLIVYTRNLSNALTDVVFSFIVYKP